MTTNTATNGLPPTWVWTRRGTNGFWSARDTRWDATIPDLVDLGS